MSNSDTGEGCISEVTLAISSARSCHNQAGARRTLDSPDSDESGRSQSFTVRSYCTDNGSANNSKGLPDAASTPLPFDDLRIPIVGYEVMEERARFTVSHIKSSLSSLK